VLGHISAYLHLLALQDVWLLSLVRSLLVVVLVTAAPSTRRVRFSAPEPARHKALRAALGAVASLQEALLLLKAVAVAVGAPDDVRPVPASPRTPRPFAGLAYM
jgi:hypothetical protein